jgi:hypothetical protein
MSRDRGFIDLLRAATDYLSSYLQFTSYRYTNRKIHTDLQSRRIMVSVSNAWIGAVLAKELCTAVSEPSKWAGDDVVAEVEIDVERIARILATKLPARYGTRVCESGGRIEVIRLNQQSGRESAMTG